MQYTQNFPNPQNFSNPFLLEPDNFQFLQHLKPHYNRGLRRVLIFCLFILVIGVGLFTYLTWRIWDIHNQYEQFGVSTQGTVVDRTYSTGRSTTYYIYYSFTVPGWDTPYQRKQDVSYDFYHENKQGSSIPIEYLSNDPTTSKIAGRDADLTWYIVFGVLIALSLFFIFLIVRNIIRRNQLERTGRLIPARITRAFLQEKRNRRRRYYVLQLDYEFLSPAGNHIFKHEKYVRNDLQGQPLPPPGTPLVVLYANDQLYSLL